LVHDHGNGSLKKVLEKIHFLTLSSNHLISMGIFRSAFPLLVAIHEECASIHNILTF